MAIPSSFSETSANATTGISGVAACALAAAVFAAASAVWPWAWAGAAGCSLLGAGIELKRRGRGRVLAAEQKALAALADASAGFSGTTSMPVATGSITAVATAASEALRMLAVEQGNLRGVINSVPDPMLVTDPSGLARMWNRAAEELLLRPGDRIAGRSIDELFTSADLVELHRSAVSGATARATIKLPGSAGIRWYEVVSSPIAWKSGREQPASDERPAVVLSLRDITELAAASELQSDFVANASHELRTPLASIRGAAETLLDDSDDPALRQKLLVMIATNVARLEELIRDLLELSRMDAADAGPAAEEFSISSISSSLASAFASMTRERSVELRFEMDPGLDAMHSDPRLLDLILRNLIENALKFAYEGTAVLVRGEVADGAGSTGFTGARFRVIDQGQGIPLASQSRIFERFYQVDASRAGGPHRRGTGLGLAIVKSAVEALGGTIRVESVWKQGTTMTVELPSCVRAPGGDRTTDQGT